MTSRRLSEDPASFESRLLRAARAETPSRESKKRAAAAAALIASGMALEGGTALKLGLVKKLGGGLVGLSLIGGGIAAGTYLRQPVLASDDTPVERAAAQPLEITTRATLEPAFAPPESAAPIVATPSKAPRPRQVPPKADADEQSRETESELTLVRRAKGQLAAGHPAEVLETLATRARAYPQGTLEEEVSALHILALAAMGTPSARAEASRFAASYPESPYGERIETALKKLTMTNTARSR